MKEENKIFNKSFFVFVIPILVILWAIFFKDLLFGGFFFWEDQLNYFYPIRMFAATSFDKWGITFWNPYMFSGVPFIADVQTAYFYPTNLLFNIIYKISGGFGYGGYQIFALLHMLLMSVATFVAVRIHKGSVLKSLFFAIFYTYASFNTLHFIHFSFIQTTLLFPLIISLFAKYLQKSDKRIGMYLAISIGISFLGGYAQYLYGLMIFLSLFWAYNIYSTEAYKNKKTLISKFVLLVYLGLGVSLSFFQWIPTADFVKETTRKDLTLKDSQISSVDYKRAINFISPKFYGEISPEAKNRVTPYWWGSRVNYEYWETAMFFGVIPLMFFIFTIIGLSRKEKVLSILVILFLIGLMLGKNFFLYKLFFNYLPGFDMFRNAGRYSYFLLLFVFSVLLFKSEDVFEKIKMKNALITAGVISVISILFYILTKFPYPAYQSFSLVQIVISLFFIGLSVVVLKLDKSKQNIFWFILLVAVFVDLKLADSNFASSSIDPERVHGVINPPKQFMSSNTERIRIKSRTARSMTWERNSGMLMGIELVEGYNPLMLNDFFQFWFNSHNVIVAEMLNVKYALNAQKQQYVRLNYWPRYFFTNNINITDDVKNYNGKLTKQDAKTLFATVTEDIGVKKGTNLKQKISNSIYTPDLQKFNVFTSKKSLFVSNEVYFKNFKAKLDGKEVKVIKANGIHRAVVVPEGEHTLEFYYDLKVFYIGAAASIIGFFFLILMYIKQRR